MTAARRDAGWPEIHAPKTRIGRFWNGATHRHPAARWIDDWWYERANIPSMAISIGSEVSIWMIGLLLTPLPAVFVIATARLSANLNEMHTISLAARYRCLDLFNQPQTWERRPDGSIGRVDGFAGSRLAREEFTGSPMSRAKQWATGHISDLWTQRRRLPGFIIGTATPVLAFVLGTALGVPLIVTTALTYFTVVLQAAPLIRSGVLAALHGSTDYFNRPQLHAPPERHRRGSEVSISGYGLAPPSDTDGPAPIAAATTGVAKPPRPAVTPPPQAPQTRPLPGVARAQRAAVATPAAGRPVSRSIDL